MKKTLLLSFVIAVTTMGAQNVESRFAMQQVSGRQVENSAVDQHSEKVRFINTPPSKVPTFTKDDFIVDPQGTHSKYIHYGDGTISPWGNVSYSSPNGLILDMVVDGETVYLRQLIGTENIVYSGVEAYVKGTIKGNTITVEFPQPVVLWDIMDDEIVYAAIGKKVIGEDEDGEYVSYVEDTENNKVTYTRDENGVWNIEESLTGPDWTPDRLLGLFESNGAWYGISEWNSKWKPFDLVPVTVPEDAEDIKLSEIYSYPYNPKYGYFIDGKIKDNKIYIPSQYVYLPDTYFVGEIKGDKVTFASNQFLGLDDKLVCNFGVGTYSVNVENDEEVYNVNALPEVTMNFDPETYSITSQDDVVFFINYGDYKEGLELSNVTFYNPSFKRFEEVATVPALPTVKTLRDFYEKDGYVYLTAEVPNFDNEGNVLDESKLYYKIYLKAEADSEAELYVLTSDKYPGLTKLELENVSEIPYGLKTDGVSSYNGRVSVKMFVPMPAAIGVQSVYCGGDERKESEINWMTLIESVGGIEAGKATVVDIYGIDGIRRNSLMRGLNIVRMSDGTVKKIFEK